MNESYIRNVLEAALLAAGKPLQLAELGQLFDESARPKVDDIRAGLDALAAEYSSRGIEVKETAAGFRIQVRREFSSEVSRLWPERPARYSRALLETLALIAYRQPITRAEIEAVRGVAVNPNIIKTVIERNWVRVVGHRDVPGRPELLGTTREFLDYFGLRSLDELPPLAELKAMSDYNPQLELSDAAALAEGKVEGESSTSEGEITEVAAVAVAGLLANESSGDDYGEGREAGGELNEGVDAVPEAGATIDEGTEAVASHGSDASEAEAERTLASAEVSQLDPEPDDSETSESASDTSDSLEADDSSDDDADDELSADGHGSRELVAAPHDLDD